MKVHVQEVFCLLSARGYKLSGPSYPDRHRGGSSITFLASRLMPTGGVANVHIALPGDFSDVYPFPETSMGESGIKESGDLCALIGNVRSRAR